MKLFLLGAGGHGKVVLDIAEELGLCVNAFVDHNTTKTELLGYPIIHQVPVDAHLVLSLGNNFIRKIIAKDCAQYEFLSLVHPSANVSRRAILDLGTVVMAGAMINSCSKIGKHCIINTGAIIEHDCLVGDFAHVSPSAALAGSVEVGEGSHIGIGASVIQGVKIGCNCMIGAGSVIIKDVPNNAVVVGNRGRIIKYLEN